GGQGVAARARRIEHVGGGQAVPGVLPALREPLTAPDEGDDVTVGALLRTGAGACRDLGGRGAGGAVGRTAVRDHLRLTRPCGRRRPRRRPGPRAAGGWRGPARTSPVSASKREPWHGQSSSASSCRSAQPLWVQYPE